MTGAGLREASVGEHPFDELPGLDLPMPDFDSEPAPAAAPLTAARTGNCTVHVRSFRDPVAAIEPVARLLGLDESATAQHIAAAPFSIREGLDAASAQALVESLLAIGAVAYVDDPAAAAAASANPSSPPRLASPRNPSSPPQPSAPSNPTAPPRPSSTIDAPTDDDWMLFWRELPLAFVAPFMGRGALLLLVAALAGGLAALTFMVPGILGMASAIAIVLTSFGLLTEVFAKLAQAAAARGPGESPGADFGLPGFSTLFFNGLVTLFAAGLLACLPAVVFRASESRALLFAAVVLPYLWWPMALTVQGISGRSLGMFDVIAVIRGIFAAPLAYLAVVFTSIWLVIGVPLATYAAGGSMEPSDGVVVYIVRFCAAFASMAYIHGVMGYLMGALVRSKSSKFAFLLQ